MKFSLGKHMWQPGIENAIYRICKEKNISIIHANHCREIVAAQKVAQKLPVKIIYTRHITSYLPDHILKGCDGIIGVSKQVTNYVIQRCKSSNLATQNITYLPPFLNEQAVKKFNPQRSKEQFFQEVGNVTIKPYPLLCKIANFYADVTHKNHPLLFRALAKLIHHDQVPVQVALAGDGANRRLYEQMVKDHNLEEYVYFLGNLSQEQIIELLFHSTVNVLASSHEAFGIVLLEAAIMKKPSIIATDTGAAEELILHNKTGLLFENNNADSLALAIKYLIQNPDICQVLGHHAYEHIEQHFSNHATTLKMLAFYKQIAGK